MSSAQSAVAQDRISRSAQAEADVVLSGIRKTYGDVVAVDSIDLEIARGEACVDWFGWSDAWALIRAG